MLVSYANKTQDTFSDKAFGKSFIYNRNKKGPSIDPWGTPCFTQVHCEEDFSPKVVLSSCFF